jgi:hypothetical protein
MSARQLNGALPRRACDRCCGIISSFGWLAAAILVVLGGWAPAHAAARGVAVEVRAATHAEFGRLVLEWPSAVEVAHERLDDRFVVRFDRPFDADLAIAPARLGGYLKSVEVAADGRAAVLHLQPGVTPTLDVHDARIVVIDLRHWATDEIRFRTGVHQGYARIVLDWGEPIAFATEDDEQSLRISFARPLKIDAAALAKRLPYWLRWADIGPKGGGSELWLRLREDVHPLVFQMGEDRLVIDLHEPASFAAASSSQQASPSASTVRALMAPAASDAAPTPTEDTASTVESDRPAQATAPTPETPAAAEDVEATPVGASTDHEMAGAESETMPLGTAESTDGAPGERVQPLRLQFRPEVTADEKALAFAWSRPIGAAVLIRAGHLWTVFADSLGSAAELPPFTPAIEGFLGPGEVVEAEGGVAVRFALRRPLGVLVERSGARWRIRLVEEPVLPQPFDVVRTDDPHQLRLLVEGPFARVRARDPHVGDMLEFWPLLHAGRGLPAARRLVDLELLATAQGIAWRPLADGLRSLVEAAGIDLPTPHGPTLSVGSPITDGAAPAPTPTSETPARPGSAPQPAPTAPIDLDAEVEAHRPAPTGSLDLARWGSAAPGDLRKRRPHDPSGG